MTVTQTFPDPCGCDAPEDGRLVSVDAALTRGLALAAGLPPLAVETVPLAAATGRVLAVEARAPAPLPSFDNSAMDGYAVRLADLAGAGPWRLPVSGRVAAGEAAPAMTPGAALRILTGAPAPADADAVLMQEHVAREGDAIRIAARPRAGLNIRRAGEDLASGGRILPAGAVIGPREAAALAAVGMGAVPVRRRLRAALVCTGSELRAPGEPLGPGQIWDANRYALGAAMAAPWIEVADLGVAADDPAALSAVLREAAAGADLVVTTGGVSVGDEDHMPRLFREAGGEAHVLKVAMKPGKPFALGRLGDAIWLGLPGNPVSAFTAWTVFGARVAAERAGVADHAPRSLLARADFALTRRPGRCEFRPARLTGTAPGGAPTVALLSPSFSARIALLAAADGLALIPAEEEEIRRGDLLGFMPF